MCLSRFLWEALNRAGACVTKREQEVIHKHFDDSAEQGINALVQRHHIARIPENWIAFSSARTSYSPVTTEKPVAVKRIKCQSYVIPPHFCFVQVLMLFLQMGKICCCNNKMSEMPK